MICNPVALPGRNHQYFLRIINGAEGVAFAGNVKFYKIPIEEIHCLKIEGTGV